jgi:hypothetical protein
VGERFVALLRDSAQTLFDVIRGYQIQAEREQTGWIQPVHEPLRADGRAPKPSRFPIRELPTASDNAMWVSAAVPSNTGYWVKCKTSVLSETSAFDSFRMSTLA